MKAGILPKVKAATTPSPPFAASHKILVQRKCASGNKSGIGRECGECNEERLQRTAVNFLPKLTISQPGDVFEREADRIADAVGSDSVASTSKLTLHNNSESPKSDPAPSVISEVLQSNGQPLDARTCARMTQRFGYDFAHVRVHTDARAAKSAQAVRAHAYTVGEHIVFAPGRYTPATVAGQKLLAHELAHVVQQRHLGAHHLVQRAAVEYVEQVADNESTAAQILNKFDQSVTSIEQNVKSQSGPQMADLTAAAVQLKSLRTAGKVAVWRMITTPPVFATFHAGSGQLRLNYSYPETAIAESTLVHEAIHAVHAARNPEISAAYGKGLQSGIPATDTATVALLHKWKAWTEYWAYRRAAEYSAGARLAQDPEMGHRVAMANSDVKVSVMTAKGDDPNFDPKTWQPTAADKTTALRFIGKSAATAKP